MSRFATVIAGISIALMTVGTALSPEVTAATAQTSLTSLETSIDLSNTTTGSIGATGSIGLGQ